MKKLSIVIPVYNEKETIQLIVEKLENLDLEIDKEIIIVDDFSIDGTREVIKKYENRHTVLYHQKNCGKGRALRTGFERVSGDIVLIQDADLEYDPQEYSILIKPIIDGKADVVYGSRLMTAHPHRVLFFWHYLGNRFLTFLSNLLTNLNLTDMETCYKVFTKEVLDKILPELKSDRFGIEPEITARFAKKGFRVYEVGISYAGRTYKEGKKIGWKDGLSTIWQIIRFNLFD